MNVEESSYRRCLEESVSEVSKCTVCLHRMLEFWWITADLCVGNTHLGHLATTQMCFLYMATPRLAGQMSLDQLTSLAFD